MQDGDGPIIALSLEDLQLSCDDFSRGAGREGRDATTTAAGGASAELNQAIDDIDHMLHDVLTDGHAQRSNARHADEAQVRERPSR